MSTKYKLKKMEASASDFDLIMKQLIETHKEKINEQI